MWTKRTGMAAAVSLLLLLVLASSAQAGVWVVGGSKFVAGEAESFTSKLKSTNFSLEGTIGKTPLKLAATGVECAECKIEQIGSGELARANGSGSYKMTGVSVVKPAECKAASIIIVVVTETERIRFLGWTIWHRVVEKEIPLGKVELSGCSIAGTYELTGETAGKVNKYGVFGVTQPIAFSEAAQREAEVSMSLGGNKAFFTGEIISELSGKFKGKEWGMVE
jgi:hypothetical protein